MFDIIPADIPANLRGVKPKVDFDEPWQDEPHLEPLMQDTYCRQLWCSVLFAGLREVFDSRDPGDESWLVTEDFRIVCSLAGMEPEAVLDKLDRFIARGEIPPGLYQSGRNFVEQEKAAI